MKHRQKAIHSLAVAVAVAVAAVATAPALGAQLPGLPVLQNAFAGPGLAAAVNGGGGSGGSAYAAALGWAPRSARFQVSAGGGIYLTDDETGGAFGVRAAVPIFQMMNRSLGVAAFGGVGGAKGPRGPTGRVGLGQAPVGASVGYRRALGQTRGFSVYGAPFVVVYRNDVGGEAQTAVRFRFSVGGDFAFTRSLGVTAGVEAGQQRRQVDAPGTSGALWGVGATYAFGRR